MTNDDMGPPPRVKLTVTIERVGIDSYCDVLQANGHPVYYGEIVGQRTAELNAKRHRFVLGITGDDDE